MSAMLQTTNMSSMSELFELLDKLQSSRLDDQRCELPARPVVRPPATRVLDRVLGRDPPYPQVVVEGSSYWVDPGDQADQADEPDTHIQEYIVQSFYMRKNCPYCLYFFVLECSIKHIGCI